MKKVSIIVPIYNAEEYIRRCIDSLINQTYKNIEIILLNDGSTDSTDKIIKSYKDKRINYIKKENTGIGNTRNLGILKSTGDYIMFIDSDDYMELNAVEVLVNKAISNNYDLVVCNYYLNTPSTELKISFPDSIDNTNIISNPNILTDINYAPWNKIYHKKLFLNDNNRFVEGIKYEDAPFVIESICASKKVGFTNEYLFHYVMQKSGETITRDERIFDIFKICEIIDEKVTKYNYQYKTNILVKILSSYLKNSRYIDNRNLRKKFINTTYKYLNSVDSDWHKCSYLKKETTLKRLILSYKSLLKLVNFITNLK